MPFSSEPVDTRPIAISATILPLDPLNPTPTATADQSLEQHIRAFFTNKSDLKITRRITSRTVPLYVITAIRRIHHEHADDHRYTTWAIVKLVLRLGTYTIMDFPEYKALASIHKSILMNTDTKWNEHHERLHYGVPHIIQSHGLRINKRLDAACTESTEEQLRDMTEATGVPLYTYATMGLITGLSKSTGSLVPSEALTAFRAEVTAFRQYLQREAE